MFLWSSLVHVFPNNLSDSVNSALANGARTLQTLFLGQVKNLEAFSEANDDFFHFQRHNQFLLRGLPGYNELENLVLEVSQRILNDTDSPSASIDVLAWTSVYTAGVYHGPHTHTGESLVCVYYAETNSCSASIVFLDPRGFIPPFGDHLSITPETGTLICFPDWLAHLVGASTCNGRVAYAFNQKKKKLDSI
jgi:Putative 2OG-Fe(II) oxygenase